MMKDRRQSVAVLHAIEREKRAGRGRETAGL